MDLDLEWLGDVECVRDEMLMRRVCDVCECRIGTCRKKVMGLLRLMGNKADVVKGLAKRCNENWRVAPTSDIVRPFRSSVFLVAPAS